MARFLPPIKMPRLPRVIATMTDDDGPKVVGLDNRPSYQAGYRPEVGVFPSIGLILQENGDFLLTETEEFIRYV